MSISSSLRLRQGFSPIPANAILASEIWSFAATSRAATPTMAKSPNLLANSVNDQPARSGISGIEASRIISSLESVIDFARPVVAESCAFHCASLLISHAKLRVVVRRILPGSFYLKSLPKRERLVNEIIRTIITAPATAKDCLLRRPYIILGDHVAFRLSVFCPVNFSLRRQSHGQTTVRKVRMGIQSTNIGFYLSIVDMTLVEDAKKQLGWK